MQDFKQRRSTPHKPWLRRRLRLAFGRRQKPSLPKGFRPLPNPPKRQRETAWHLPRVRSVRAPLTFLYGSVLLWLVVGSVWNGWEMMTAPMERVKLSGNTKLSGSQVLAAAGLVPGLPMSDVDAIEVTRRLAIQPHIAAVDVRRVYPGSVWIDIRERTPDLRVLVNGAVAIVDKDDVVIRSGAAREQALPVPIVQGVASSVVPGQVLRDPGLQRAREFLGMVKAAGLASDRIAGLDVSHPFMLAVVLTDGQRWLFSTANVAAELRILRDLQASQPLTSATGKTIDLRAAAQEDGRIVLRP